MLATAISCVVVICVLAWYFYCVRVKDKPDKIETTPPDNKDSRKTETLNKRHMFPDQADITQPRLFTRDSKQIQAQQFSISEPTPISSKINVVRRLEAESPETKEYAAEFLCEGRNIENVWNQRCKDKHLAFFIQHDVPHLTRRLVAYKQAFAAKVKRIEDNDIATDDEAEEKQVMKFEAEVMSSFKQKLESFENELRSKFVQKNKEIMDSLVDEYNEDDDKDSLVTELRVLWNNYVLVTRDREKWLFRMAVAMQDQHDIPLTESETTSVAEDLFSDEQTAAEWSETIIANQEEQERIERQWGFVGVMIYVVIPLLLSMLVVGLLLIGAALTSVVAVIVASLMCCFAMHCFQVGRRDKEEPEQNIVDNGHP